MAGAKMILKNKTICLIVKKIEFGSFTNIECF